MADQQDLFAPKEREPDGGEHAEGPYRYSLWRRIPEDSIEWPRVGESTERMIIKARNGAESTIAIDGHDHSKHRLCWIMLNPSTANAEVNDPTMGRVRHFTAAAGYGFLDVVNLYAHRSSDPKEIRKLTAAGRTDVAIGPRNDLVIAAVLSTAAAVVLAWGAIHGPEIERARTVLQGVKLARFTAKDRGGLPILHLGVTKGGGDPRHPLYMPNDTRLEPWGSEDVHYLTAEVLRLRGQG